MKVSSSILIILLLGSMILPLFVGGNVDSRENVANESSTVSSSDNFTWYDDCSNITGWQYYTEWDGYTRWATASGTLASDDGYLHCPVNSGYATGPFWFKSFNENVSLADFESWSLRDEVNQPSQSYKGNLWICLFDEYKQRVFMMGIYSWDELEHAVHIYTWYTFENGSSVAYYVEGMNPNFFGNVSIYYEEGTGLMGHIDTQGDGLILEESLWSLETSRNISYIGVQWRRGTGTYLDHHLHDIAINTNFEIPEAPEEVVYMSSWHDDCSNISGWQDHSLWDGYTRWDTASGTLASDDGYLHCPVNSGYATGPFWFKSLDKNISLAEFGSWNIIDEVIQPSQSYKGNLWLCLFDEYKQRVFMMGIYSWDELEHAVHIYTWYTFENGSSVAYYVEGMNPNFFGNISIYYQAGIGLKGYIETQGTCLLLNEDQWKQESSRNISYVGAQWRKGTGTYLDQRLHDISIISEPAVTVDHPDDLDFEYGETGHEIIWNIDYHDSANYSIYDNGTLMVNSTWDGEPIRFNLDSIESGNHNISIEIDGAYGDTVIDTVWVTIEPASSPNVSSPPDILYEAGTIGHQIIWNLWDRNPGHYYLFKDDLLQLEGSWENGEKIYVVDELDPGDYDITIIVGDAFGLNSSDSVVVTVVDTTAPEITGPSDANYTQGEDIDLVWTATDLYPSLYEVHVDGVLAETGDWNGGIINYNPINLAAGNHNITLKVIDESGNFATDTVNVFIIGPDMMMITIIIVSGGVIVAVVVIGAYVCKKGSSSAPSEYVYS